MIRLATNRLVEHLDCAGVRRIGEKRTLRVKLETSRFDLSAHGRRLNAVLCFGYICGSARSGGMIENDIHTTGLQRTVDGLVKRSGVDRAHKLIM